MRDAPRTLPLGAVACWVRTAVTAFALTSVVGLAAVQSLGTGADDTAPAPSRTEAAAGAADRVTHLLGRHGCSTTGLDDVVPGGALLRTPSGGTRHVTFDRGWASYAGDAAGTLLAVCLDPPPTRRH